MLHLKNGLIYFNDTELGPRDRILTDSGEFRGVHGVTHLNMPGRMDTVFAVGDRVAAAEIKYPADLVTSHQKRRLARQLRHNRKIADIGILFLRDFDQDKVMMAQRTVQLALRAHNRKYVVPYLWQDLAGFQTQGGYVLHLPEDDEKAVEFIRWYQTGLATSGTRMFTGTDLGKKPEGTMLRGIKGIGPKMERDLLARYTTPLGVGLAAKQAPELVTEHYGPSILRKLRAAFLVAPLDKHDKLETKE